MFPYLPKPPKVVFEDKEKNLGVFEIEGLYSGYGITIGNALRRVLLSSLPGAAITSFKIKGAPHEFSTIPGILEDVVEIMLNLKQVRLKLHSDEPQILFLKAKGEGEVKAGDIETGASVEIANPELHIATLTSKNAALEMELTAEKGMGYSTVEQRKKEKLAIGTILLDAIFSPVKKVNYEVENMRVGERTDFNRLQVSIETDGTMTPAEAFSEAAQILIDHFNIAAGITGIKTEEKEAPLKAKKPAKKIKKEVKKKAAKAKKKK